MSAAPLEIREATVADVDAIVAIERECFGDPWTPHMFKTLIATTPGAVAVATADGQVIGFWVGSRVADEAELQNIAVHGQWRRHGVGRRLLEDFLATMGADEDATVFLEVRESNHAAQRLYVAYGFEVIDRRPGYYSKPDEAALVMARRAQQDG